MIAFQTFGDDSLDVSGWFYHRDCLKCVECNRGPDAETPMMLGDYVILWLYEEDILITLQLQDQRKLTMCLKKRSCYPSVNSVLLKDTKCLHWMLQSLWQLFEINYVVTPIISTSFINNWTILKYLFFKCMKWRNTQLLC